MSGDDCLWAKKKKKVSEVEFAMRDKKNIIERSMKMAGFEPSNCCLWTHTNRSSDWAISTNVAFAIEIFESLTQVGIKPTSMWITPYQHFNIDIVNNG